MVKLRVLVVIFIAFSFTVMALFATRVSVINHFLYDDYIISKLRAMDKKEMSKKLIIYDFMQKKKPISFPKKPDKTAKSIISAKDRIIFIRKRKNFLKKRITRNFYRKSLVNAKVSL